MNLNMRRQAIELDVACLSVAKALEREKVYEAVEKAIGLLEEEQRQRGKRNKAILQGPWRWCWRNI